jgi:flavin-dependent dehydrogenase
MQPDLPRPGPRGRRDDAEMICPAAGARTDGPPQTRPVMLCTGDQVYIGCAGAYTTVYACTFNGFDLQGVRSGRLRGW